MAKKLSRVAAGQSWWSVSKSFPKDKVVFIRKVVTSVAGGMVRYDIFYPYPDESAVTGIKYNRHKSFVDIDDFREHNFKTRALARRSVIYAPYNYTLEQAIEIARKQAIKYKVKLDKARAKLESVGLDAHCKSS